MNYDSARMFIEHFAAVHRWNGWHTYTHELDIDCMALNRGIPTSSACSDRSDNSSACCITAFPFVQSLPSAPAIYTSLSLSQPFSPPTSHSPAISRPHHPVTLNQFALTGSPNSASATNAVKLNPIPLLTALVCVLGTLNPAGCRYKISTYLCAYGGFSTGGAGPTYALGEVSFVVRVKRLLVAMVEDVNPVRRQCRFVTREPAAPPTSAPGLGGYVS